MKRAVIYAAAIVVLAIAFNYCYAQADQNEITSETGQKAPDTSQKSVPPKTKVEFVKMVDFYLKDGRLISGKLVSKDDNKIVVETLGEGNIVVNTYSNREMGYKTLKTRDILEYKYYIDLAKHFSGRSWDFKDDPDDFIQAIRSYEKAKQCLSEDSNSNSEKIGEINEAIKQLEADRQVWIREVESRAKLKKLEFEAVIESRVKELEDKFNANIQKVNANTEQDSKFLTEVKVDSQKLQDRINKIEENLTRQLRILEERIEADRRLIIWLLRHPHWYAEHLTPPQVPELGIKSE